MPYFEQKVAKSKYSVKKGSHVYSKHTSKTKADKQIRLLNAIDHGWKPTGSKGKGK